MHFQLPTPVRRFTELLRSRRRENPCNTRGFFCPRLGRVVNMPVYVGKCRWPAEAKKGCRNASEGKCVFESAESAKRCVHAVAVAGLLCSCYIVVCMQDRSAQSISLRASLRICVKTQTPIVSTYSKRHG